jgi:hypothetical protein
MFGYEKTKWILAVCVLISIIISCSTSSILQAESLSKEFNLQSAIDCSHDGDVIIVPDGIYKGIDFKGKAIIVVSENGPKHCIINGGGTGSNGSFYGVIFNENEGSDTILQGFTITNCMKGGAIYCGRNTGPIIINCIIKDNCDQLSTVHGGGGIYCDRQSCPLCMRCQIINNSVLSPMGGYAYGGGVFATYATPKFISCVITNNSAIFSGGSRGHSAGGGLAAMYGSEPIVLKSCVIVNNSADWAGGGLCIRYGQQVHVQGCTLSNNRALGFSCPYPIEGIGGALYCGESADVRIRSSLLWNNSPHEIYISAPYESASVDIDFCDLKGGFEGIEYCHNYQGMINYGEMNINVDPLFKNPTKGNFHLHRTSPCLDAGEKTPEIYSPSGGEKDIDGQPRINDISWISLPGKGPMDIGADEAHLLYYQEHFIGNHS